MMILLKGWFVLVLFLGLGWVSAGSPPESISWDRLTDVRFKKKFYPEEGVVMLYPTFGPSVKALAGRTVNISGYV